MRQYTSLYKCPADRSYIILGGNRHLRVRSYAINEYMNPVDGIALAIDEGGQEVYHKLSDFRRLAQCNAIVFADEHEDSINDGKFEVGYRPTSWDELPAARHAERGAFSFADGHAETHKWKDARTLLPVRRSVPAPYIGIPQANNPDLYWVFEHATAYLKK